MNKKNLYRHLKKSPVKLILLFISFITPVYLFGFIVHEVLWEKEETADRIVSEFIAHNFVSDSLTEVMKIITFFASIVFLLVAYTALAPWYLLYKKSKLLALDIGVNFILFGKAKAHSPQKIHSPRSIQIGLPLIAPMGHNFKAEKLIEIKEGKIVIANLDKLKNLLY